MTPNIPEIIEKSKKDHWKQTKNYWRFLIFEMVTHILLCLYAQNMMIFSEKL